MIIKIKSEKSIPLSSFFWIIDKSRRDATEEVDILRRYSHHPNVVKLYTVYEDSTNVYLVEEMCQGGELLNKIMTLKHFSEREAAAVMLRLANAISYLHSNQVWYYKILRIVWRKKILIRLFC